MKFTPAEISSFIIAVFGLLLTILNILDKIAQANERAKKPEIEQNQRIGAVEARMQSLEYQTEKKLQEYQSWLSNDNKKIKSLEDGQEAYGIALLAILSGDEEQKKNAYAELNRYLTKTK